MLKLLVLAQAFLLSGDFRREEGQGLVEYSLILGLVVVGAILFLTTLGGKVTSIVSRVANSIT